ncbi:hypothetical protein GCM10027422_01350 [Hymenobacter arcticus]
MHGTIFTLLKRYVQTQYDHSTWLKLVDAADLKSGDFSHKEVYPDEHMYALIGQAATKIGVSPGELHEKFGEYLVPDLMYMYQKYINPDWRTLEMLENTEHSLHNQVRREHPENSPPVLQVKRLNANEVMINYVSPRRMGGLAIGIVRGLAAYYDEADRIDVMPTTSEDGERVQIHVRRGSK